MTLIDLGRATPRMYGGAGLALDGPATEVEAQLSERTDLIGLEGMSNRDRASIVAALERLHENHSCARCRVRVLTRPMEHVGLGSKTALILAILQAVAVQNKLPLEPEELRILSGRGGTSGVGVHSFFTGGFLIDAGHPQDLRRPLAPSSMGPPLRSPLLVHRSPIPTAWRFHILLAPDQRIEGASESDFFLQNTPIRPEEVLAVLASVYHGLIPAFAESDLTLLKQTLARIQATGFKRRELEAHPGAQRVMRQLDQISDCAAGLSSIGPAVYAISDVADMDTNESIRKIASKTGSIYFGPYSGRNAGSIVSSANE